MASMAVRLAALRALENKYGKVMPEVLVAEAADKEHPLHGDFPWDDKIAAHKHRLDIARRIISSVRVAYETETRTIKAVAYVRDPDAAPNQGYRRLDKIINERDAAREVLAQEVARIAGMLDRAQEIAAVLDLEDEFEAAVQAVRQLSVAIGRAGPRAAIDEEAINMT